MTSCVWSLLNKKTIEVKLFIASVLLGDFSAIYLWDLTGLYSLLNPYICLWANACKIQMETLSLSYYLVVESAGHCLYFSQGWAFGYLYTWKTVFPLTCKVVKWPSQSGWEMTEERSTSSLIFVIFICNTLGPSFKLQYFYTQDTVMHNPYFNFLLLQPQFKITILETKIL